MPQRNFVSALALVSLLVCSSCRDTAPETGESHFTRSRGEASNPRLPGQLGTGKTLDQLTHTNWSIRDGLPQSSVQTLLQSASGHIWIGTQEGLVRFNGLDFTVFDRANTMGIPGNHVTAFVELGLDTLLVGTYGGGLYTLSSGVAAGLNAALGLESDRISALAREPNGGIWIGHESSGLEHLNDGRLESFGTSEGLPDDRIRALLYQESGRLWVGTASGLATIVGASVDPAPIRELTRAEITALASDRRGGIWIGTTAGLYHWDGETASRYTTSDGLAHDWIMSLFVDAGGTLVVGTMEGLTRIHQEEFSSLALHGGTSGNIISALLVDRDGILWLGTATSGLHQLREATITTYTSRHGLTTDIVYAIHGSRTGGLWVGSYYGDVDYYDGERFRSVLPRTRLNSGRLRSLHEDRRGRLWIGSEGALHLYDAGRLTTFTERDGFPGVAVRAIEEDNDGTVWVGTDGSGLFLVRGSMLVPFEGEPALPAPAVRAIHTDGDGRLWIATYGGLSVLEDGGFRTYTVADGLVNNQVRTIHESADGTMWIGTYGGGVSRFKDGEFVNITTADGLHNDAVYQILEDGNGDLWMSSNTGIFTVRASVLDGFAAGIRDRIVSVAFNETDGMLNRECNGGYPGGYRSTTDTRLWFPTVGGLAVVDLGSVPNNLSAPVVIERFAIDNVDVPLAGSISLEPGSRRLTFEYAALNYSAPEKTQYRYRLHGYDIDWVYAGGDRVAQFTRLRPGTYQFEVQASIAEGVWTSQRAALEFNLLAAFYQQFWFFALCMLALAFLAYGVYRRRVYALRRNEQILQAKVDEAIEKVQVLHGLLPVCSHCKKVRDDHGYWNQIEVYIGQHSDAEVSHSLCPDCLQAHYPDFAEETMRTLNRHSGRIPTSEPEISPKRIDGKH